MGAGDSQSGLSLGVVPLFLEGKVNEILFRKIFDKVEKYPGEAEAYSDYFELCRSVEAENFGYAHMANAKLRKSLSAAIKDKVNVTELFEIYRKSLLFDAPHSLDPYLLYMEIDREPKDRFYLPRRWRLKEIVDALQMLVDDELDELITSEPPRTGKTTIILFVLTWILGKYPELANLYSAYSGFITDAMYNGVLEVINDPVTYKWHDVFPTAKIVQTNAADDILNINRRKRYPSLTCRSLYGTLNGACDCNGFLIADDLIGGIEEALSKDRLASAWAKVDNNLIPRAKENAKLWWNGTRWSIADPQGKRIDLLENSPEFAGRRYKIINIPALNEKDESNFDYAYGVGFSTEFYRQRRSSFEKNGDIASWNAQYMGQPIEREGTLFSPSELRFYNGVLPEGEPDRILFAIDPAFGGGDYTAGPIGIEYGDDIYVPDVIFDNGDKTQTQPKIAKLIGNYLPGRTQLELTRATESYLDGVNEELTARGIRATLTRKAAPTTKSKVERIYDKAPDIRERLIFLEPGKRSREYEAFMQNLYSFKLVGNNKHDDAPDSCAMLMDMFLGRIIKADTFKRPF